MDVCGRRGFQPRPNRAYPAPMTHRAPLRSRRLAASLCLAGAASAAGLWSWAQAGSSPQDRSWIEESSAAFEARLGAVDPAAWSPAFEQALWTALRGEPREATRAVLLLARDPSAATTEGLLQVLEERADYPERPDDAGACTAAAHLSQRELTDTQLDRLEGLALDAPHPDLEVRTECAIAAFSHGRRAAGRFLIRVLRIDTASEAVEGALTDSTTTAWSRGRAATCLTDAFGLPRENWTDASLAERERRANDLSRLLGEPDPCLDR